MKAVVYSQPGCNPCILVKNYLLDKGIEVEVRDIRENSEYLDALITLGFQSTPVTAVDGKKPVAGFNPPALDSLFE